MANLNVTTAGASGQYGATARVAFQALQGPGYSLHLGGDVEVLLSPPVGPATTATAGKRTLTLSDRPELRIDPTTLALVKKNTNYDETMLFRLAAVWAPTENLTITPGFYYQDRYRNDVEDYWPLYSNPSKDRYVSANPALRLVVLAKHGLVVWGESAEEAYRRLVNKDGGQ